ncbi:MAG: competence protein CoiA [Rickettsiales bacterium]
MRFALVDGQKTEPQPKLKGACPSCKSTVLARCGEVRVWHWAHKGILSCDPWWEKETEWHRGWKSHFPIEWQEVAHLDEITKEKHIADVKTDAGLVVEFQHSSIKPEERRAREQFYKNIVWVVNGGRLKRDFSRFLEGKSDFHKIKDGLYLVHWRDEVFPKRWIDSSVPVIFDFRGAIVTDENEKAHEYLWCLLPANNTSQSAVIVFTPEQFVTLVKGDLLVREINQAALDATNYQIMLARRREAEALAAISNAFHRNAYRPRRYRRF